MPRKATPQNKTPTAGQLERLREELELSREAIVPAVATQRKRSRTPAVRSKARR